MYTLREIFTFIEGQPLIFTQYLFWLFFTVLLIFYCLIYKNNQLRIIYLFAFSVFFYYKSAGFYFWLLIFSTIFDYYVGNQIYRAKSEIARKLLVALSVSMNLLVLAYFKYAYFFTETLNTLFHTNFKTYNYLADLGNQITGTGRFDVWTVILPVGVSFYTFQTISYAIDLYRKKIEPVRNILDFGFFVTYFPQLVAGPIVRAAEFIPQLYKPYSLSREDFGRAGFLILNGLIKKMLISDYISINFVDRVFDNPTLYSGFENLMAVYGYSIQIYCDFSGYTDIAIGLSILLGYHLPINFNSPYKAINITDFWRRWHISLSTWLKDYLYISLGGNRKGKFRMYVNLFITMLLGGLWHGAHVRFIIWGALHGVGLAFHKMWMQIFPPKEKENKLVLFFSAVLTFHFVAFCWIFFRASNMHVVNQVLSQIIYHFQPELVGKIITGYGNIFSVMLLGYFVHILPVRLKDKIRSAFMWMPLPAKALAATIIVILLYQVISSGVQPFIYFQF